MTASDRAHVDALYRRHHAMLLRALRRALPGADESRLEDGAAQAWVQLCHKQPGWIDPERDPIGWLFAVARNHVRRSLAKPTAQLATDDGESGEGWTAVDPRRVETEAEQRAVLDRVESLSRGQRTAVVGRMVGLSYAETAQATGQTYTWVNRHTTEGRARLRALVA